jgi:predicted RNA-binding protein YlxR (DUF448 family)
MRRRPRRRTVTTPDPDPTAPDQPTESAAEPFAPVAGESFAPVTGDDAPETGPLRRCLVTRERAEKATMIRFVVGPDRALVPDLSARLPGRGMWLSARADVVETARTRGAFARAARGVVAVPPDLLARLRAGLERRIADLLGLTRRAGQAVAGFDKAGEWVRSGRAALVVQAADGSTEERRRFLSGRDIPTVAPLPAAVLGAVFGRDRAVHVAVAPGKLAAALRTEAERLAGLVAPDGGETGRGRVARQASSPARPAGAARDDGARQGGQRQGSRRQDGRLDGSGAAEAQANGHGPTDRRTGIARQAG